MQGLPVLSFFTSKKIHEDAGSVGMKSLRAFALLGAGVSGFLSFATIASADEAEHGLACPSYPWPHKGILSSYDHASYVLFLRCYSLYKAYKLTHLINMCNLKCGKL